MHEACCGENRIKVRTDEEKKALSNRLKRIEGQVRGLCAMVEKDAYCPDILTQASAAAAAINGVAKALLSEHIRTCVAEDVRQGKDEVIDELLGTMQKWMK